MAITGHGHHIPGTSRSEFKPKDVTPCGGVNECPRCQSEVRSSMAFRPVESTLNLKVVSPAVPN